MSNKERATEDLEVEIRVKRTDGSYEEKNLYAIETLYNPTTVLAIIRNYTEDCFKTMDAIGVKTKESWVNGELADVGETL